MKATISTNKPLPFLQRFGKVGQFTSLTREFFKRTFIVLINVLYLLSVS